MMPLNSSAFKTSIHVKGPKPGIITTQVVVLSIVKFRSESEIFISHPPYASNQCVEHCEILGRKRHFELTFGKKLYIVELLTSLDAPRCR